MLSLLTPVTREDKTRYTVIDLLRGQGVEKGIEKGRQKDIEHSSAHTPFWAAGREGVKRAVRAYAVFPWFPGSPHNAARFPAWLRRRCPRIKPDAKNTVSHKTVSGAQQSGFSLSGPWRLSLRVSDFL